jgi:hypothetical protein
MKPLKRSTKNGKSASSGSIAVTTTDPLQFGVSTRGSTITRTDSSITVTTTSVTMTGVNIAMTTTKNNAIGTSAMTPPSTAIAEETRTGTDIAAAMTEGSIAKPTTGATIANATTMPGINNAVTMTGTAIAATATSGSVAEMMTTEKHDSRQKTEGNNEVSIMFGMFFSKME